MVIWGFPKLEGYPKSSTSSSEVDYFTNETHGDLGIPHFKKPHIVLYSNIYIYMLHVLDIASTY